MISTNIVKINNSNDDDAHKIWRGFVVGSNITSSRIRGADNTDTDMYIHPEIENGICLNRRRNITEKTTSWMERPCASASGHDTDATIAF